MQSPCYAVIVMQSPWGGACPACWLSKKRLSRLKVHTIVVVIIVMIMIIIVTIDPIVSGTRKKRQKTNANDWKKKI